MAKLKIRGVQYYVKQWNEHAEDVLVLLHGFTGSTATWLPIVELLPESIRVVAIDLLGHGQTETPENYERYMMSEQLTDLNAIFELLHIHHFSLLGYSMGGRVALSFAEKYPNRLKLLILESASPGIENEQERNERRLADNTLADKIEQLGIDGFVEFWENIPLFATQKTLPIVKQQAIRRERLSQNEYGLANSLRGLGTGVQPSLWEELGKMNLHVCLITGELDVKFCNVAEQMLKRLTNARYFKVNKAGHAIHVENPVQFATIVKEQLLLS